MKSDSIKVDFIGQSADGVTGSCYLVNFGEKKILLDYGLFQSSNIVENYKINHARKKGFKPKEIDYIFISHANIDHCGAIPELFAKGCTAKVYVPEGNRELIKMMLIDSVKIMESDAEKLSKQRGMKATLLYTLDDVDAAIANFVELPIGERIEIDENLEVKYYHAHHIINAAQIVLYFGGEIEKRLCYTGDIGSPTIYKPYLHDIEFPHEYCDILIGESTYGADKRNHSVRDRKKDDEKLESYIEDVCIHSCGKMLIPVFAMDRLQNILTELYLIFGEKDFHVPIVIDTPLGTNVTNLWKDIIPVDKELWDKVIHWENIRFVTDWNDSVGYQESDEPMVILSSSGMLTNGRSVSWAKKLLVKANCCIAFCGYSSEDSLASKIKNSKDYKKIEIEGRKYKNECKVIILNSFSSHACRSELVEAYTERYNYGKLYLVHGDEDAKLSIAEEVNRINGDNGKTCRAIVGCIGGAARM